MDHKYFGGADHHGVQTDGASVVDSIEAALRPIALSVGLDELAITQAVERQMTRHVARQAFDTLETEGIAVRSMRVLDLGAGLGHASVEAVARGCDLVAVEPGIEWCTVVRRRLDEAGSGVAIVGDGEQLPFADNEFDLVVSIGVLEHVRRPAVFLREAHRVLKPGGYMYLSCENYLSFVEPHYQLRWLPLFPKSLASRYLGLRGRSSEFLLSSITYTTRPGVNRRLRSMGFGFKREMNLRAKFRALLGPVWRAGRIAPDGATATIAESIAARLAFWFENFRMVFTPYYATIVQKRRP